MTAPHSRATVEGGNDKVVWTLIIIFTHLIGPDIHYFLRRAARRLAAAT